METWLIKYGMGCLVSVLLLSVASLLFLSGYAIGWKNRKKYTEASKETIYSALSTIKTEIGNIAR